jgi:hypothetical protein
MPKTGSTALQGCLQTSRARLAGRGILYPENPTGCAFNNHRMLILGFVNFEKLPRHVRRYPEITKANVSEKYTEFIDCIGDQIARDRPECLVISSETLFRRLGIKARRSLLRALEPSAGSFVVAVYLRRPSEYYLSNLQQRLKHSYNIGRILLPSSYGVLQSYASTFGRDMIRPRIYDRGHLYNGDIVGDFFRYYMAEFAVDVESLERGHSNNETVSAESMDLLRRYRKDFHAGSDNVIAEDSAALVRLLRRTDKLVGAPKPRLRPEIADMIDYSRIDPLRLRDEYDVVFPDLDYRRFERRARVPWILAVKPWKDWRLSDLVSIDRPIQREILRSILRSGWAKADPDRRPWVDERLRDPAV